MSITVYGASDDLIEIEGDIREEFQGGDGVVYLGFSEGTVLSIEYSRNGIWRITPYFRGLASLDIELASLDDEDNYSDRAILEMTGVGVIRWVVAGRSLAV
jgi:hypothetical protein